MNKYKGILLFIIITAIAVFYILTTREGQVWGEDFAQYIQHAKNIVERKPYGNTGYIFTLLPPFPPGTKAYPPIFPLFLVPIYGLFGPNLAIMKIGIILFFIASLVVIYLLFKQRLGFYCLFFTIMIVGFNPYLWDFKENIVSDMPFLFFSCLCLYVLEWRLTVKRGESNMLSLLGTACLLYLAFGTRTIGITLLLAYIVYNIVKLRRISPSLVKIIIFYTILVGIQQVIIRAFPTYHKELFITFKSPFTNIIFYIKGVAILFHNGYIVGPTIIFAAYLIGLALLGYIKRVREGATIVEFYTLIYIVAIIMWPHKDIRYLIPIIPLFLFYTFYGIDKGINILIGRRAFLVISVIGCVSSYSAKYTTTNYGRIEGVTNRECIELFNYIKENTSFNDALIFTRPRVLSLYTERKSAVFPFKWRDEEIWQYFKEINATHIVVGSEHFKIGKAKAFGIDQRYVISFVRKYESNLYLVYSNINFKVYKILWKEGEGDESIEVSKKNYSFVPG